MQPFFNESECIPDVWHTMLMLWLHCMEPSKLEPFFVGIQNCDMSLKRIVLEQTLVTTNPLQQKELSQNSK